LFIQQLPLPLQETCFCNDLYIFIITACIQALILLIYLEDTTATEIKLLANYSVATGIEVGLLINFGSTGVDIKRKYRTPKEKL